MSNVFEEMDSKSIYLRKGAEIIGLHAIGYNNSQWTVLELDETETLHHGFQAMEAWGNQYDENLEMIGRGSFRVFDDISKVADEFIIDGWEPFNPNGSGAV